MPRGQEPTPFYIRTADGDTFYVDTLEEALREFVSDNGYRLTLTAGENEIVIRRSDWVDPDSTDEDGPLLLPWEKFAAAGIILRKK